MADITTELGDLTVTDKAIVEIKKIILENKLTAETHGLRLGVKGGGCSGMIYSLAFDENTRENDNIIELDGVRLFVDPKSLFYLGGTILDYSDGLSGRGLVFNNPNAAKTCGCGSSFAV